VKRHKGTCVTLASDTFVYLADGTKVVVRRNKATVGRAWLEVVPQVIVRATDKAKKNRKTTCWGPTNCCGGYFGSDGTNSIMS